MAAVEHEGLKGTRGIRRAMPAQGTMELREPETGPPIIFGHFLVWNQWAEINSLFEGHFLERFSPGSADKTLRENAHRMRCLFQHGEDPTIGRKALGPWTVLEPDETGCYYEVEMLTKEDGSLVSYCEDLLPGLREGLYGSSCLFDVIKFTPVPRGRVSDYNPQGLEERTITEIKIIEFGPCIFQWYEGATASARSETDEYMLRRLAEDPERFIEVAERAGITLPSKRSADVDVTSQSSANASQSWIVTGTEAATQLNRRYQRAIERFGNTAWACTPEHLELLQAILAERKAGYQPTQEELNDRIADGRPSPASDPNGRAETTAVIPIGGTIMPHAASFDKVSQSGTSIEGLQQALRSAQADSNIKNILLNIDSPGGAVDLVPEFGAEVKAAADAYTADPENNPKVTALANTMAASAAYWIMSQANEAVASPSGQVGSIGVYSAHEDVSAQQEAKGVKTTLVSAGKYKVEGNPFEPLSEDAQAQIQKRVDGWYSMFLDAVAAGRGTDKKDVEDNYGQGRMMVASEAMDAGLIDRIATLDDVLAELELAPAEADVIMEVDTEPVVAAELITSPDMVTPIEPEPVRATTQTESDDEPTVGWIFGSEEDPWTLGQQ